jgi:hypothetical protein
MVVLQILQAGSRDVFSGRAGEKVPYIVTLQV